MAPRAPGQRSRPRVQAVGMGSSVVYGDDGEDPAARRRQDAVGVWQVGAHGQPAHGCYPCCLKRSLK
eukprot:11161905-Lingulodinium_polyedra.AAC.1